MDTLASILRNATFIDRPEARSGEELYWHSLASQYIAVPRLSASADQVLRQHGWQSTQPGQAKALAFQPLPALRRLWPDLHKPHPDLIAHRLTDENCKKLIDLQPLEDRGAMGRWLMGRCKALGKHETASMVTQYMAATGVQANHPWSTSKDNHNQFLLSKDLGSAFLLTGTEATGYTLHTFITGDSAARLRSGETIRDLMTPNNEWSEADWAHYDALLTAKPTSTEVFWSHPALIKFLGTRNKLLDPASTTNWVNRVRQEGTIALLGERQSILRRMFLAAPPASWLDHMADDLGIRPDSNESYRMLTDCWMSLRASDAECREHILPAMRNANPEAFADFTNDSLLALWRACFQPITDNIRQQKGAAKNEIIRRTSAFTDMRPEAMREVLAAHYGQSVISALEQAGKLHLLSTYDDLPAPIQMKNSGQLPFIAGATTTDNTVYLIGNRITPKTLPGLFLHEVGEHAALADMLGPDYGRMSKHFQRLLRDKDTYATWAAMRVPSSTRTDHVASEQLAYLIERVANDEQAAPGGEGGYALGQECLSNLRTWLFRTPMCRWLDDIGALDDFTLRPQDMAAMAREGVDFFVEKIQPGTVTKNRNEWTDKLNPNTLEALYRASAADRIHQLEALDADQSLGYLYALSMTKAPLIGTALEHFSATLANLAAGKGKPEHRALAGELLSLQQQMLNTDQLRAQFERNGFAMWVDSTSTPESSRLYFLTPSPKNPGKWQLNHYQRGIGAYHDDQYDTVEQALSQASVSSFMVPDDEAATSLEDWAALAAPDTQINSKSFARWFGESKVVDSQGKPLRLYHGTGADIVAFDPSLAEASLSGEATGVPGFYFSPDASVANGYARKREAGGNNVMPVYLALNNPVTVNYAELIGGTFNRATLEAQGFDGVNVQRDGETWAYIAFEPTQIKSAIGNLGTFDPANADVRLAAFERPPVDPVTALKNWSGDNKIVGDDGLPLVVFHGTGGDITRFNPAMIGKGADDGSASTEAFWFSSSELVSDMFANLTDTPSIMPVFIKMQNPLEVDCEEWARRYDTLHEGFKYGEGRVSYNIRWFKQNAIDQARADGHDGVIFHKGYDGRPVEGATNYAVFEPTQIKSAIGNIGTYDPTNSDIRYSASQAATSNKIRQKPSAPTETPQFKTWFKDSKVLGDDGGPLIVYHGTKSDFSEFDPEKMGVSDEGLAGKGFYFTYNPEEASSYALRDNFGSGDAPNVIPAYISLQNPLVITHGVLPDGRKVQELHGGIGINANGGAAVRKLAVDGGYDGVMWVSREGSVRHVMAFNSEQIKSAIGNRGTFDPTDSDIRYKTNAPTETPQFKAWFDQSKVVDESNRPLTVFHGTEEAFTVFEPSERGTFGPGIYFTGNQSSAAEYGEHVIQAHLSLKNPWIVKVDYDSDGASSEDFDSPSVEAILSLPHGRALLDAAKNSDGLYDSGLHLVLVELGYDGVIASYGDGSKEFVAFKPEQVKSATLNNGDFDPNNADIRFKSESAADLPGFDAWFAGSKILSDAGQPLVLYHGTDKNFTSFEGSEIFFADSEYAARQYGKNVMPVYLNMTNPLVVDYYGNGDNDIEFDIEQAREDGHDGLIVRRAFDGRLVFDQYVAFDPNQIKLALAAGNSVIPQPAVEPKVKTATDTQPFRTWFDQSKIVDDAGKPLVVYHGTGSDFASFDPAMIGQNFNQSTLGFYFTNAPKPDPLGGFGYGSTASEYAANAEGYPNVMPVYLSIQNPLILDDAAEWGGGVSAIDKRASDIARWAKVNGYDGVIAKDGTGEDAEVIYIAFRPEQIKSAIGNVGTFDSNNSDIRFSFAGENAQTAYRDLLSQAQARTEAGEDAELVRTQTGWFVGNDQRWRFEIDDSKASLPDNWYQDGEANGHPVTRMDGYLGDHLAELHPVAAARLGRTTLSVTGILNHPQLFAAYPELSTINVVLERSDGFNFAESGEFRRSTVDDQPYDSILVRYNPSRGGNGLSALLHEVQHAVQKVEGFARGGSTREFEAEALINGELNSINQRINQLLQDNPETATVYRAYIQLRVRANDAGWPEHLMGSVAALESELIELPGGSDLFDLETERFGIQFIDKVAMPFEKYHRLAGEVEARNVQARLGFDSQMRLDIAPAATEDVTPDLLDVRMNAQPVMRAALQQEQEEREGTISTALDMSRDARLARAQALGFDTSKVWYHGSEKSGFRVFDTDGKQREKTEGTGAFFASDHSMARGYSGTTDDAPLFSGQELFAAPDLTEYLEIERFWAVVSKSGRVTEYTLQDQYDSAETWIEAEGLELEEGERLEARFTVYHEGECPVELGDEAETITALDELKLAQPGIYSVFLRTEDVLEVDWKGRNWDQGPTETVWRIVAPDGDLIDFIYKQDEVAEALANNPGAIAEMDENPIYNSTDDAARQARDCEYDAILIRNVQDTGPHSQYSDGDVMVVFDPKNIRSVNAAFNPEHSASGDLLFSIVEAPQSSVFDQWFDGSLVCNEDGTPLVVYRGEHGKGATDAVFQSRLGSLSFGDYATANLYATTPNNLNDNPVNPRVIPAYLSIKRPLMLDSEDPFIDFSALIAALGTSRSIEIARDLDGFIRNTQAWADIDTDLSVGEYLDQHPEALSSLYVEVYPILDRPKYVDWLKAAGFDGAIYGGSGASFGTTEYRVFDPSQVASGAPMPAATSAPTAATRMALSAPVRLDNELVGSPASGQQFTMQQHGYILPGQYGYGIYLPASKAVERAASAGDKLNSYAGRMLTPAAIKSLRAEPATAPALRQFLAQNSKALAAGVDAQQLLQAHIRDVQNKLASIDADYSALLRGEPRPLSAAHYAQMERLVKTDLGSLIHSLPKFESKPVDLTSAQQAVDTQYLQWGSALCLQPQAVREALALVGFDGYWEVHGQQETRSFYSRIEADAHFARLQKQGDATVLVSDFGDDHPALLTGAEIYRELSALLGSSQAASASLQEAGIKGIRYLRPGDPTDSLVVFDKPLPRPSNDETPIMRIQQGSNQPAYPLPLSALTGVVFAGSVADLSPSLQRSIRQRIAAAEAKVETLNERQKWLSDLPNADPSVVQRNHAALTQARSEHRGLLRWRAPAGDNCLPWNSPLTNATCKRLSGLIRVSDDEQLTGEAVFHLLAERHGGNKAAIQALGKVGIIGAHGDQQLILWDQVSQVLANQLDAKEGNRFHLVAHGSKHMIDAFSSDKIGTGEGVQAFGYGLYFADRKMVAMHYQKMRVREGCWYDRTFYDHPSEMVQEVAQRLTNASVSAELLDAAKHCLSIVTWAPQRLESVIELYPQHQEPLKEILNGYGKVSSDQLTNFFIMPKHGVRSLNDIAAHDDRDYSMGLFYLSSGLHFYVREDMSDLQVSQVLADHVHRQCDVEHALEARNEVLLDLERNPCDNYLQSRLRDCDYYLKMAQCAKKTLDAYGPFKLERPLGNGNLYLVDLAINPGEYLRYDLPYSQQSSRVQQAIQSLASEPLLTESKQQAVIKGISENLMGHDLLAAVAGRRTYYESAQQEDEKLAASILLEKGVQGIKYPDGLSRDSGGGSFNYVVFNDERIQILGHTDKHLRSESDQIPLYEWTDTSTLDGHQRMAM